MKKVVCSYRLTKTWPRSLARPLGGVLPPAGGKGTAPAACRLKSVLIAP